MAELEPKERAALHAANVVRPGTRLGLGGGSTINLVVAALGQRMANRELYDLKIVVASSRTEQTALAAGLPLTTLYDQPQLDLAIDGADEIDRQRNMIKGGGGALLRERIVLAAAAQRLIVVDESKLVQTLGERWALPVEVVQFGLPVAEAALRQLGAQPQLRMAGTQPFVTDEGNYILDCRWDLIHDPRALAHELCSIPGMVAHGLFLGLADRVIVGSADSVWEM